MVIKDGVDFDALDDEPVTSAVSDRSAKYQGQRASGCVKQAVMLC